MDARDLLVLRPVPAVIAHRGASAHSPENTLAAYELAIRHGATLGECDVQLTADGEVVLLHDTTVDRTTSGTGAIAALTAAEVGHLDAGSWFDAAFAGEGVPTLGAVLDHVRDRLVLCIEIKAGQGIEARIRDLLDARGQRAQVILFSFDVDAIAACVAAMPDVPALLLADGDEDPTALVGTAHDVGAVGLGLDHTRVGSAIVDAAHEAGLPVWVYTPNTPEDVRRALSLGVDGLITDYPRRVAAEVAVTR